MGFYAECGCPEYFESFLLPGEGSQAETASQQLASQPPSGVVREGGGVQSCFPSPNPESSGWFY